MEEKETTAEDSIEYLLGNILRSKHGYSSNAGLRDRRIDKIQDNNVAELFCNFTSRE
jgi:hypothetical protein